MTRARRFQKLISFCGWSDTHKELSFLIPLGWSTKPRYHLEYLAYSEGLKTKWLLVCFDWWKPGDRRYVEGRPNWRYQRQVKHFATRWTRWVND